MTVTVEYTDTFGGEANYCWVRRAYIRDTSKLTTRQIMLRVKAWAGLTGHRCNVCHYGDMIELRPLGLCRVIFVNWVDAELPDLLNCGDAI